MRNEITSHSTLSWLAPLTLGAVAMLLLDPAQGRRRRALLRDKTTSLARRSRLAAGGLTEDLQNRARGVAARLRPGRDTDPDDAVITARVRSAIGRVCSHPGAVAVSTVNGIVQLNGPVLASEHDDVLSAVENTRGVLAVNNHMTQHESAENVPGLQGEGSLPESDGWSPSAIAVACGAAALVTYALVSRTAVGTEVRRVAQTYVPRVGRTSAPAAVARENESATR